MQHVAWNLSRMPQLLVGLATGAPPGDYASAPAARPVLSDEWRAAPGFMTLLVFLVPMAGVLAASGRALRSDPQARKVARALGLFSILPTVAAVFFMPEPSWLLILAAMVWMMTAHAALYLFAAHRLIAAGLFLIWSSALVLLPPRASWDLATARAQFHDLAARSDLPATGLTLVPAGGSLARLLDRPALKVIAMQDLTRLPSDALWLGLVTPRATGFDLISRNDFSFVCLTDRQARLLAEEPVGAVWLADPASYGWRIEQGSDGGCRIMGWRVRGAA